MCFTVTEPDNVQPKGLLLFWLVSLVCFTGSLVQHSSQVAVVTHRRTINRACELQVRCKDHCASAQGRGWGLPKLGSKQENVERLMVAGHRIEGWTASQLPDGCGYTWL